MRPARGRPPSGPGKRSCVVRLEKVQAPSIRQDEAAEDDRKKMTGPLKKRPVVMKKSPGTSSGARQTRRRAGTEDLSEYMLVTARAKRTPKPNPKYSNEDIVTPRMRGRETAEESEPEEEDAYQSSDITEPQEESSEDDFEPAKPVTRGVGRPPNGEIVKRGPGRPPRNKTAVVTPKPTLKRRLDSQNGSKDLESILEQNKRLNIELYDASDSDVSAVTPTSRRTIRSASSAQSKRPVSRLVGKSQQQQQKDAPKRFPERRRAQQTAQHRSRVSSDEDDPEEYETTGVASTVDDFETMPTFTIVNINDIINKKGDVMIEQTNRVNNNSSAGNNNKQPSARKEESRISPSQASRNRRKSMHTTILSDKIDPDKLKNPPPRSPFPPRNPVSPHNTLNHNLSKSMLSTSQNYSSAPRILNNVLCRRTKALQAKQEQLQEQKQQLQLGQVNTPKGAESRSEHTIQSKENHLSNFRSASGQVGSEGYSTPSVNRKLPSSKVVVQRQGNKIIKKITCFETWYVINIPNIETQQPKYRLDMTLMHLANTARGISLPSDEWSFKINLQKISPSQVHSLDEVFAGDIPELNIKESEKHNYMPVSVMFRRTSSNQKLRMPYDRAVIFKNENYITNIEGKNVRLLGSPQKINSHEDIEILLQIMDEMTLVNPLVEQVAYIM